MSIDLMGISVLIALLLAPVAVQLYVQRLPVAPACPACRSTTRSLGERILVRWLPLFSVTTLAECVRCGWRGRMRWRWAPRRIVRRTR